MTLQTTTPLIDYLENGFTLDHAVPFQFIASTDIACSRIANGVETMLTLGTDYTVSGGGGSTGTVTKTNGGTIGTIFRIKRETSRAQSMDYTPGDAFPAESHEAALDRLAAVDQEQDVSIGDLERRAVRVPAGETAPLLPNKIARAGKFLAGDAQGDLVPTDGTGSDGALRGDLAAIDGVNLIGFDPGLSYDNGSLGAFLKSSISGPAIADVAIAAGQLVNLTVSAGVTHMSLADASVSNKPAHAFCTEAAAMGGTGTWCRRGIVPGTSAAAFASALWLSQTVPGAWQTSPPANTAGMVSQHLGMVLPGIGVEFTPQLEIVL